MSEQDKLSEAAPQFHSMTEAAAHEGIPMATRLDDVSENSQESIVRTPTTFDADDTAALRDYIHNTAVREMYPDPLTLPPTSLHQKLMEATREAITDASHLALTLDGKPPSLDIAAIRELDITESYPDTFPILHVNLEDPESIEKVMAQVRERHPELLPGLVARYLATQAKGNDGAANFSAGIAQFAKQATVPTIDPDSELGVLLKQTAARMDNEAVEGWLKVAADLETYRKDHSIPQMSIDTSFEPHYLSLLQHILEHGWTKSDRTGTGTQSLFGNMLRIDMRDGRLPLLTTKKLFHRTFVHETLWFLSGSTDIKYLKENNIHIWDDWVIPETAVWNRLNAPAASHRDAITRLRCNFNSKWKEWKKYCESNEIGQPTNTQLLQWIDGVGLDTLVREDIFSWQLIDGSIGPGAYGTQWRKWDDVRIVQPHERAEMQRRGYKTVVQKIENTQLSVMERTIDQIANAIELLKTNPDSRRIIVSAWNPGRLEDAALPPCHSFFQFFSRAKTIDELRAAIGKADVGMSEQDLINGNVPGKILLQIAEQNKVPMRNLSLMLVCRSQDYAVGSAFNIPQYVVLANFIASVTGHDTEDFIWVGGDTHVYANQVKLAREQLQRTPFEATARLVIRNKRTNIDQYVFDDLAVEGYDNFYPHIPFPVAV